MSDTPMSDDEFLNYCDAHADTPRCGFVPEQIARLARLAGEEEIAAVWDAKPLNIHDMDRDDVREFVKRAWNLRKSAEPTH